MFIKNTILNKRLKCFFYAIVNKKIIRTFAKKLKR